MRVILPQKRDALAIEGYESMVGDGHAVGVTAELPEHLRGPAESRLGIDDPILPVEATEELPKLFFVGQGGGRSGAT